MFRLFIVLFYLYEIKTYKCFSETYHIKLCNFYNKISNTKFTKKYLIYCLFHEKNAEKIWSKDLMYDKTFRLSSHSPGTV